MTNTIALALAIISLLISLYAYLDSDRAVKEAIKRRETLEKELEELRK